jgi:nucleoid-associated protein YgaU
VVTDGESLHSIAQREYDDARLWRGLAAFNAIEDPMRPLSGTALHIPPRETAAGLS